MRSAPERGRFLRDIVMEKGAMFLYHKGIKEPKGYGRIKIWQSLR